MCGTAVVFLLFFFFFFFFLLLFFFLLFSWWWLEVRSGSKEMHSFDKKSIRSGQSIISPATKKAQSSIQLLETFNALLGYSHFNLHQRLHKDLESGIFQFRQIFFFFFFFFFSNFSKFFFFFSEVDGQWLRMLPAQLDANHPPGG